MKSILLEGGNVFEGTGPVSKEEVLPTLVALNEKVLKPAGVRFNPNTQVLGGTGKKPQSNDLDIWIIAEDAFPDITADDFDEDPNPYLKDLGDRIGGFAPDVSVNTGFRSVHVKFPVFTPDGEQTDRFAQIDMIVGPKETEIPLFFHSASKPTDYKKVTIVRNCLLVALVGAIQETPSEGVRSRYSYLPLSGIFKKTEKSREGRGGKIKWDLIGKELASRNPYQFLQKVFGKDISSPTQLETPEEVISLANDYASSLKSDDARQEFYDAFIERAEDVCRGMRPLPEDMEKVRGLIASAAKPYVSGAVEEMAEEEDPPALHREVSSRLLDAVARTNELDSIQNEFGQSAVIRLGFSDGNLLEVWEDDEGEVFNSEVITSDMSECLDILNLNPDLPLNSVNEVLTSISHSIRNGNIPADRLKEAVMLERKIERDLDVLDFLTDAYEALFSEDTISSVLLERHTKLSDEEKKANARARDLAKYVQKLLSTKVKDVKKDIETPAEVESTLIGKIKDKGQKYFSIKHASDLLETPEGKKMISALLKEDVWITEKVDGAQFGIIKDAKGKVFYRSKNFILTKPMMMSGEWDVLVSRLEKVREKTNNFDFLPDNSQVIGEMMLSTKHNQLVYKRVPKGNLVVFDIKFADCYQSDYETLKEIATLLEAEPSNLIFHGKLNKKQKDSVMLFLSTPVEERRKKLFGTGSFTEYILGILNPAVKPMLGPDMEGVVIKYYPVECAPPTFTKLVDPQFTETIIQKGESMEASTTTGFLNWVLETYVTENRLNKAADYVFKEFIPASKKKYSADQIYALIVETVFNDIMKEQKDALYGKFKKGKYQAPEALQQSMVLNVRQLLDPDTTIPNLEHEDKNFALTLKELLKYLMLRLAKTGARKRKEE